jgi:hypothetical protein
VETPAAEPARAEIDLRAISRAALVTALAIALPPVFHAVKLGSIFLPMYLPILAGAFFLPPRWAAVAGASAPLISALLTGMPPFFPPVAFWMSAELSAAGTVIALLDSRFRPSPVLSVVAGLLAARVVQAGLVFLSAFLIELPPGVLTIATFVASWPGMVLALVVVPAAVALTRKEWK